MNGTEKQIKWAEAIKADVIESTKIFCGRIPSIRSPKFWEKISAWLETKQDAKWWIEHGRGWEFINDSDERVRFGMAVDEKLQLALVPGFGRYMVQQFLFESQHHA